MVDVKTTTWAVLTFFFVLMAYLLALNSLKVDGNLALLVRLHLMFLLGAIASFTARETWHSVEEVKWMGSDEDIEDDTAS